MAASSSTALAAVPGPSLLDDVLAAGIDMVLDASCFRRGRGRALIVGSTVSKALGQRDTVRCWRAWVAKVDSGRHIHRQLNRVIRVVLHTELRRGYNTWEAKWRERRDSLLFVRRVMGRMMHFHLAASLDKWRQFRGVHGHAMRAMRRGAALLVASSLMTGFARWRAHHAHRTANLLMLRRTGGGLGRRQIAWGFRKICSYSAGQSALTRGLAALGHTSYMRAWNSWLELLEVRRLNRGRERRALSRFAEQETVAALEQLRRRVRDARILATAARHLLSRRQARAWEAWLELRELRRHAFGLVARALAIFSNKQLAACVRWWARTVQIGNRLGGAMRLLSVEGLQKGWRAWAYAHAARHASMRLLGKSLALLRQNGLAVAYAIWRYHGYAYGVLRLAVRHLEQREVRAGWNSWLESVDNRQLALGRVRRALSQLCNRSLAGAFSRWRTLRELAVLTGAAAHRVSLLIDYAALGLEKLTVALTHARFHAIRRGWRAWLHTSSLLSRPAAAAALLARRVAKRRLRAAEGKHRAIVDAAATRWERREKRAARPLMLEAAAAHRILALSAAFDMLAYDADVAPERSPTHTRVASSTAADAADAAAAAGASSVSATSGSASAATTPTKAAAAAAAAATTTTTTGATGVAAAHAVAPVGATTSYAVASSYATPTSTMPISAVGSYVPPSSATTSSCVVASTWPGSTAVAGHATPSDAASASLVVPAYTFPSYGAAIDAVASHAVASNAPPGYAVSPVGGQTAMFYGRREMLDAGAQAAGATTAQLPAGPVGPAAPAALAPSRRAAAPPPPAVMQVAVPPGIAAGQTLSAVGPGGQQYSVTVPPGLLPGQSLTFQPPPPPPASTATATAAAVAATSTVVTPHQAMMQVEVPPGILPGQPMIVQAPNGTTVKVVIPPDLAPGQTLQVALPDAPGSSTAPPPQAPPPAAATGSSAAAPAAEEEATPSRTSSLAATGSGDASATSMPRAKSAPSFPAPPPRVGSAAGAMGAATYKSSPSPTPSPRSGGPPVMKFHQPPGRGSLQRQHTVSWLNPAPPRGSDKADLRKKRLYNSQRKGLIAEFTPSKERRTSGAYPAGATAPG